MKRRMRVERAGSQTTGYEAGWFATQIGRHLYTGTGEWFPTWREAMEHAAGGPLVSEATA